MSARQPDNIDRAAFRLSGASALAAGTATSNTGVLYDIVPVRGSAKVRVRIKTATNGGTIDLILLGPDFDQGQCRATGSTSAVAYASLVGTQYTTGNPTQVAVTAGTEAKIEITDLTGEGYVLIKFTGTVGVGAISYVDVSQI